MCCAKNWVYDLQMRADSTLKTICRYIKDVKKLKRLIKISNRM